MMIPVIDEQATGTTSGGTSGGNPRYARALALYCDEGLTYREIATAMGVVPSHARYMVHAECRRRGVRLVRRGRAQTRRFELRPILRTQHERAEAQAAPQRRKDGAA